MKRTMKTNCLNHRLNHRLSCWFRTIGTRCLELRSCRKNRCGCRRPSLTFGYTRKLLVLADRIRMLADCPQIRIGYIHPVPQSDPYLATSANWGRSSGRGNRPSRNSDGLPYSKSDRDLPARGNRRQIACCRRRRIDIWRRCIARS